MTLHNGTHGTDGQTDGQTDRQTECDAIFGPSYGGGPHNKLAAEAKWLNTNTECRLM